MGIAIFKVTRDMLPEVLPLVEHFGSLLSVTYPPFRLDPHEVRVVTPAVPNGYEQLCSIEVHKEFEGDTVTLKLTLRRIE